ncbi:hypothetical protein GCM10020218_042970 [Dactylosporangium vinaceum]
MLAPGSVSPSTITGGDAAVQTIRLTGPAPAGGIDVSITASDVVYTNSAGPSVHVPAGATSVSFPFRLSAPSTDVVRSLWAQMSGTPLIKVAEVTVLAADPSTRAVAELRFDPGAAVVGTTTTGTVTLKKPAPQGGIAVDLWSNTSYGPNVYVPPYVVVEAGRTTATFPATITGADSPAVVWPSADLGTSRVVAPLVAVPMTFALGAAVVRPGTEGELAVGIGTALNPAGTTIALTSDNPSVTVPATVTVPAGSPGVRVPVTVAASAPLGGTARITAKWNGTTVTNTVYIG